MAASSPGLPSADAELSEKNRQTAGKSPVTTQCPVPSAQCLSGSGSGALSLLPLLAVSLLSPSLSFTPCPLLALSDRLGQSAPRSSTSYASSL